MPRTNHKGKRKAPDKAPETVARPRKVIRLGERDPDTMRGESAAENYRGTRKWNAIRKAAMKPGGLFNVKSTGYGH